MPEPRNDQDQPGSEKHITFTRRGFKRGAWRAAPIVVSDAAFGLAFGVLSRNAGLSISEVALMSGLVNSGSAQVVAISMWARPIPALAIVATAALLSLRHILMGLTLQPWFTKLPRPTAYATSFFLTDESWGLTTVDFRQRPADGAFLLGAGALMYVSWVGSTVLGRVLGTAIRNPSAWGLDFAFVAVFIALLASLATGRSVVLPWAIAAVAAIAAERWLPGSWYVLIGAAAGSVPAFLRRSDA